MRTSDGTSATAPFRRRRHYNVHVVSTIMEKDVVYPPRESHERIWVHFAKANSLDKFADIADKIADYEM